MRGSGERVADGAHAQNHTATGAAQGLVSGGGHDMEAVLKWVSGLASRNQPGDVAHIGHEYCADLFTNGRKGVVVKLAWVGAKACHNQLWLMLLCQLPNSIIVKLPGVGIGHPVVDEVIFTRTAGNGCPVGEMPTVLQIHR